ncbi:MAG: aldo/keto reductase [Bacteroidales bacterium]|jgi:predicted aldo/keto reductase-like oxidoreductase|nr:aldo/keto reductase [Bacteroidales bacterium]
MDKNHNNIDRRDFLKILGAGAVASIAAMSGCNPETENKTNATTTNEVPTDKMTYRTTRRTGDKISLLGYGCMRWQTKQTDDGKEEIDQESVNELVDYAIEHGVNYFDTAPVYGQGMSETATGIALKRHPRDRFFIATKMSNHRMVGLERKETFDAGVKMFKQSLKSLQVDYIDYYLLHNVGPNGMPALKSRFYDSGLLEWLLRLRDEGQIRNLGFSFHGDVEVFDYLLAQDISWDFVQIQLNFADWKNAEGWNINAEYLYNELAKRNIQSVVMEPLLGGRLSRLNTFAIEQLKKLRPEDSPAKWALRFAASHEQVLSVLSGMTYMEHLQENICSYSPLEPLNDVERKALEEIAKMIFESGFISCTECQYCMPCPYGLDIPGIFAHYNRCINDGNMPKEAGDPEYRRQRRAFLLGYDRSVPKLRQAAHCTSCGQCNPNCTQRIDIPAEMIRIDNFVENMKREA